MFPIICVEAASWVPASCQCVLRLRVTRLRGMFLTCMPCLAYHSSYLWALEDHEPSFLAHACRSHVRKQQGLGIDIAHHLCGIWLIVSAGRVVQKVEAIDARMVGVLGHLFRGCGRRVVCSEASSLDKNSRGKNTHAHTRFHECNVAAVVKPELH